MRTVIFPAVLWIFLCLVGEVRGDSLFIFLDNGLEAGAGVLNPGEVFLKWTAPGDDGYSGRASSYDLRYQTYSKGPLDSEPEWSVAVRITGEPSPSVAGKIDSILLRGLPYGDRYYFCIRAFDEAGNASLLSNSPLMIVRDSIDCSYLPGDINGNGSINVLDLSYLLTFLYKDGPPPSPPVAADVDGSLETNMIDVIHLMSFIYREGPDPVCND